MSELTPLGVRRDDLPLEGWSDPSRGDPSSVEPEEDTDPQFTCDVCGKSFPTINSLSGHKGKHRLEHRKEPCPECGRLFILGPGMSRHRQAQHGVAKKNGAPAKSGRKKKSHLCSECGKIYSSRDSLRKHRRRVHGLRIADDEAFSEAPLFSATEWNVEEIFDVMVSLLWPKGTMPVKAVNPLIAWREATAKMLIEVQDE